MRSYRQEARTSFLLLLLLLAPGLLAAADWPQFRGPYGKGHAQATGLPRRWSEAENVAWKVAIPGRGWSSPVVVGDQIWMTTAIEETRSLRAIAVARASGKIVHDVEVFRPPAWEGSHTENSYASPTPALEPGRVYVHFGTYGTACLATEDGRLLWTTRELRLDHEVGPGSSPILFEDLLIVNCDGTDQRYVAALDKATGRVAWKAPRSVVLAGKGTHKKAFSTPIVVPWGGGRQLISAGAGQVSAYDPRTGAEIWRVRYDGYSTIPQPAAGLGMVLVGTGYVKPHLLAIRLGGRGDVTDTHVAWSYHWQVPANPSPLLIGDRIFLVSDHGIATWLDAHRGQDLWRQRLGGNYRASPLYVQGRIYTLSIDGTTVVVAAGDEYRELARNELDGLFRATPAVAGHALYLRSATHLYRIEQLDQGVAHRPASAISSAASSCQIR